MNLSINVLALAGGLGLFLFSLRYLTTILDRSMSSRLRPLLSRYLAGPGRCFLAGLGLTVLVQASSITIITAMGLLNSSLITLEQGFMVMLGATVGTTIKAWLFAGQLHLGPALIGVSSISYLLVRRPLFREILEVLLAIGLAFLGLDMVVAGIEPFRGEPAFLQIFQASDGGSLWAQCMGVLIGCTMTFVVQSSSAMIFIILDLAGQHIIGFPGGAALILGANLGTTATALLASVEVDWDGKRLALAHLAVKLAGVLSALCFFPFFLGLIDGIFHLVAPHAGVAYRLAAVHTGFNLFNAGFWAICTGFLLRSVRAATPSPARLGVALPISVRRMLATSPARALREADRQVGHLQLLTKDLTDSCFHLVLEEPGRNGSKQRSLLPRDLGDIKEGLDDLLVQLMRHPGAALQGKYVQQLLRFSDSCAALYHIGLAMRSHLERGLLLEFHSFPASLQQDMEHFQRGFDTLWLRVLFNNADPAEDPLQAALAALEQRYFAFLLDQRNARSDYLTWLYDTIGFCRQIARQLDDVYRMKLLLGEREAGAGTGPL